MTQCAQHVHKEAISEMFQICSICTQFDVFLMGTHLHKKECTVGSACDVSNKYETTTGEFSPCSYCVTLYVQIDACGKFCRWFVMFCNACHSENKTIRLSSFKIN